MRKFIEPLILACLSSLALVQSAMANPFPVPEPETLPLVGLALAVAVWVSKRAKK